MGRMDQMPSLVLKGGQWQPPTSRVFLILFSPHIGIESIEKKWGQASFLFLVSLHRHLGHSVCSLEVIPCLALLWQLLQKRHLGMGLKEVEVSWR